MIHTVFAGTVLLISLCYVVVFCVSGEEVCWRLWTDQWENNGTVGRSSEAEETSSPHWPVGWKCRSGNLGSWIIWGDETSYISATIFVWTARTFQFSFVTSPKYCRKIWQRLKWLRQVMFSCCPCLIVINDRVLKWYLKSKVYIEIPSSQASLFYVLLPSE